MDWPIPRWRQAGKGSQSQKGAITAPERHPIPNCKQTSSLTKIFGILDSQHLPGGSQPEISFPEEKHGARVYTQKPSGWDRGGDKSQPSSGDDYTFQGTGHLSYLDLLLLLSHFSRVRLCATP